MIRSRRQSRDEFVPFGEFPAELRRVVYTTNATDSHCARFRRAVRHRGHSPNEQAAMKAHLPCRHDQTQEPAQPDRQDQRPESHPEHTGRPPRRPDRRPHPTDTTTAGYTKKLTVPPGFGVCKHRSQQGLDPYPRTLNPPSPQEIAKNPQVCPVPARHRPSRHPTASEHRRTASLGAGCVGLTQMDLVLTRRIESCFVSK